MTPDGALAVNFAGVQKSKATEAVISTLLASFPKCRGFRDTHGESDDHADGSLRNMVRPPIRIPSLRFLVASLYLTPFIQVIFCTNTNEWPLTFRAPQPDKDYLSSGLRRVVLSDFAEHPIVLTDFLSSGRGIDMLQRGEAGPRMRKLQAGSGFATWRGTFSTPPV